MWVISSARSSGMAHHIADKLLRSELIRRFLNMPHRMKLAGYVENVVRGPGIA